MEEMILDSTLTDAQLKLFSSIHTIQKGLEKSITNYYDKDSTPEENRDAAFMKDLYNSVLYLEMLSREYLKDKNYPSYMIEKLEHGVDQWTAALKYFKAKQEKGGK